MAKSKYIDEDMYGAEDGADAGPSNEAGDGTGDGTGDGNGNNPVSMQNLFQL
jgi:hypothetical protein